MTETKKKWLKSLGLSESAQPADAFNKLLKKYDIDPELKSHEALKKIQEEYGVYPPISVRGKMRFTYDIRKEEFLSKYGILKKDKDGNNIILSAKEAFIALREKYSIDTNLSDKAVRKIFCIREEIKNTGFNKYRSSTIAWDVSDETVAYVEEMSNVLKGAEVSSDTVRYYPNGRLLSHVLGYMGSISDSQYDEYVKEKGYSSDDLIGKDGIEASMESVLRGKDGEKTILVNSYGDYMETIGESDPVAGSDIYLTIDSDLQKVAEDSLEKAIKATQSGTTFTSKYGNMRLSRYSKCSSGAAVAIEVDTGDVLAVASYPDYNPNIFAEGISTEDWASVQSENPRDPLAPTPLYNVALRSAVQPGSTFKPITAVAALECGLDPNRRIYDKGYIKIGDQTFGCSIWNHGRGSHGSETLALGIQNSCNYYFYCLASGKDWQTGASLGYDRKISIEKIMEVASEFGLGDKTGIELYETTTPIASAERKMAGMKASLWNNLYTNSQKYWPKSTIKDDEKLRKEIDTITGWIKDNPSRQEIIDRIEAKTTVKKSKVNTLTDVCKYSYFNQAQWGIGDVFNISIGQGDNAYTPLQMANYIATLGNEGKRNRVSIIRGIQGQGETEKEEPYQADVSESELNAVLEGMKLVTKRGTLASCFARFPVNVAGKTGTAERDGYINPKDEVAYVKDNLGRIAPGISWEEVQKEMKKLMKNDSEKYPTQNDAVDAALIAASGKKITQSKINQYKDTYDNFAWTVSMAPADNPKIAVVVMLVQGGISMNAGPVAREIIGEYLKIGGTDTKTFDFSNKMN